jgi:hypothetical protein
MADPAPPPPPSYGPDGKPHPLQAQLEDPHITLEHAMELLVFKAMQFQVHLERHDVHLAEMHNLAARIREAHFWMNELANVLQPEKPGVNIAVVQDLPSHLKNLVQP